MSTIHKKRIKDKMFRRRRTQRRLRNRLRGSADRPRLAVFKSRRYVYAQLIDDQAGRTLAQANSLEEGVRSGLEKGGCNVAAAKSVGAALAERALGLGIKTVVFDRAGFLYHGKIRALAEGAREKGLEF